VCKVAEVLWDDDNVDHLAEHQVGPGEAEDVLYERNIRSLESDPYVREGESRCLVLGRSRGGRELAIVVALLPRDWVRPVTGYDMEGDARDAWRRRKRGRKR